METLARLWADFISINHNAISHISYFLSEHLAFVLLIVLAAATTVKYLKTEIDVTVREDRPII